MITFDAVAAWHLRERGYEVHEWLANLRLHQEGRDEATGLGTATWRLRPDRPPSGSWFSTLEVTVREDGEGATAMQNLRLRGGIYLPPREGRSALLLDMEAPETMVACMPGRTVGEVADIPPVAHRPILEAWSMPDVPGIAARTQIAFEPVVEMHETPFFLLP